MSVSTDLVQIQIQSNEIFKEEKYCGCCRRDPRLVGLLLSIGLWAFLICTLYTYTAKFDRNVLQSVFMIMFPIFLIGTYISYLGEAFCNDQTPDYLRNMKLSGRNDILTYIERLKATTPVIQMSCSCYHYETRTRYVTHTYTDYVNGQSVTRTETRAETYQETVVTYNGSEIFNYREWSDNSGFVSNETYNYNLVRIDFTKTWIAADQQTQAAFDHQYDEFKRKHQNRDVYFSSSYEVLINNYEPYVSSIIERKWYLTYKFYAIITIFTPFSIFYRYWFDRYSVNAKFQYKKIVKI